MGLLIRRLLARKSVQQQRVAFAPPRRVLIAVVGGPVPGRALDAFPKRCLWLDEGTGDSGSSKKCVSTSRCVVSKPSKAAGAHGQSKARSQGGARGGSGSKSGGGAQRKSPKARTKADLEQEIAELKKINEELREQLHRQEARAEQLERINQEAGQRIDSVIGRIKTLLAS